MRSKIAVAVVVALSMGTMTSVGASTTNLSNELLSVNQMPTGWSVDNSSSGGGSGVGCLSKILEPKGVKQTSNASVEFDDNGNTPLVSEKLATFSNAQTAFTKVVATLNSCKRVSGTSGGEKATGSIGQMSFPHYGDESAAYSLSLSAQGTTLGDDLLIVREGKVVMGIQEADLPPVDVSQFQTIVATALADIRGH
jgi:hypothetical protein